MIDDAQVHLMPNANGTTWAKKICCGVACVYPPSLDLFQALSIVVVI